MTFEGRVGTSPLSTRDKRESTEKRIIMDLSWPIGDSVNSGIQKDQFMGFHAKLSFPTIDVIARRVASLKGDIWLFKVDLSGYFRQLPLDPGDYSLLCFIWNGRLYFDLVSPMGLRSAPYFAQRTSNAIRYIHNKMGFFLFNYIDDFIGAEVRSRIWASFNTFTKTLRDLEVKESIEKRIKPTQCLNCVGILVNSKEKTMAILPERKQEFMQELLQWRKKEVCTLKELQSLIGKLQFVCAVVRPGCIFLGRMLEFLRSIKTTGKIGIRDKFKKDVNWWIEFLPTFDGECILWMQQVKTPDKVAASDASLIGMGAVCGKQYIKLTFPEELQGQNIAYLELLAIIIMVKTWIHEFKGKSVVFNCDNEAVVSVLNTGRARDARLQDYLRELTFVAAGNFEFGAVHLMGKINTLPDLLSRWMEGDRIRKKIFSLTQGKGFIETQIAQSACFMTHNW